MLARSRRVRLHSEYARITRTGSKARCGCVVVYRLHLTPQSELGGTECFSRAGLIVGRSVGNAVTRHRVARVFRAQLAELLPQGDRELVVVRALPGAGSAGALQLRQDLTSALERLRSRTTEQNPDTHGLSPWGMGRGSGSGSGVSP